MGTIKRLNDQQKQQAQAEAAMPGRPARPRTYTPRHGQTR